MIQDIGNHEWNIAFTNKMPKKDSEILFFCGGLLLIKDSELGIMFPKYENVQELCKHCSYLFCLDGVDYFRVVLEKEDLPGSLKTYRWVKRRELRSLQPKEKVLLSITGMHLNGWYEKNKFCGACGNELTSDEKERMLRCNQCGNMVYPRINPAVIVGVVRGEEILLTKYRDREYKKYALVAGFAEIGESLEQTVVREVMEETGLVVKNVRYYKSQPWGFSDNILAGFFCQVDGESKIIMDQEELAVAEWVERKDIPISGEGLSLTQEMMERFKEVGYENIWKEG